MLKKRPRVLLVSAEAYPFSGSRAGETAMQSLPEAMAREGFDVSIILPKHRRPAIEALESAAVVERLPVPLGENKIPATIFRAEAGVTPPVPVDAAVDPESPRRRFPVYFVDNVKYFDRERVYGSASTPYLDNDERFTFFCRAVMEFVRKAGLSFDLVHCQDWPTALVPVFLRAQFGGRKPFRKTVSVLTVHDPASQGEFPPESFALTGLAWDLFQPEKLAVNGRFNFLCAGVLCADGLSAGSEAAAEAIRGEEAGEWLRAVIEKRRRDAAEAGEKAEGRKKKAAGRAGDEARSPGGEFELSVPGSVREYAGLYRRIMKSPQGGSHVR